MERICRYNPHELIHSTISKSEFEWIILLGAVPTLDMVFVAILKIAIILAYYNHLGARKVCSTIHWYETV